MGLLGGFQQSLLRFFLTFDAMARPRHCVQALGIDLLAAGDALSETAFPDTRQSAIDHVEQLAVVVALAEEKFLVVGAGSAIGDVLSSLVVGGATVLLITDHHLAQFVAPGLQFLSKGLEFLLIHDYAYDAYNAQPTDDRPGRLVACLK